jgi:hypothetical protein
MISWLVYKLAVRQCRSGKCQSENGWHTADLTRFGNWYYIRRHR